MIGYLGSGNWIGTVVLVGFILLVIGYFLNHSFLKALGWISVLLPITLLVLNISLFFISGQRPPQEDDQARAKIKEGELIQYYGNGKIESIETYQNGKLHGRKVKFFPTGQKAEESNYQQGILKGPVHIWYENGQKHMECIRPQAGVWVRMLNYWSRQGEQLVKDGNGVVLEYYPNGKLRSRATYTNSYPDGKIEDWDSSGDLVEVSYLQKGKLLYTEIKSEGEWMRIEE